MASAAAAFEAARQLLQWEGYEDELRTLALYAVGIGAYALVVFTFYERVSRTVPFFGAGESRGLVRLLKFVAAALTLPLMSFAYLALLAAALMLLAKDRTTAEIVLIALSVIVGIRTTAFLSQKISVDLAKLLPLGLLAVFLVDPGYLDLGRTLGRFAEVEVLAPVVVRALVAILALELALQLLRGVALALRGAGRRGGREEEPDDGGEAG